MADKLYLFSWVNRFAHPDHPGSYVGGHWVKWCAGAEGDDTTQLNRIGRALVDTARVECEAWLHIGPSAPKEPPAGANVSRVLSLFDNETPPDPQTVTAP